MPENLQVVWFKRDLRVNDHVALYTAAQHGPVLPLLIVEPSVWADASASGRQWEFYRECATELQTTLAKLGAPLVVRQHEVLPVLAELRSRLGPFTLWAHAETFTLQSFARDKAMRRWCREVGVKFHEPATFGISRPHPSRLGWATRWESFMQAPLAPTPTKLVGLKGWGGEALPQWPTPLLAPDVCPGRQSGGRCNGLALLQSFLAHRGRAYHARLSSPLTAAQSCSRLSAHLAYGSLSLREVYQRCQTELTGLRPSATTQRRALQAYLSRLYWHCHFMQKLEDEPAQELRPPNPLLTDDALGRTQDGSKFQAWATGHTGWPLVDAVMRELCATGWCTFRMRAMLVSVATQHLWLPTRQVGLHLARCFTDYEPGIHWPQIYMQAGATGANLPRIYNPTKQAIEQDPEATFIAKWVPELRPLPPCWRHQPFAAPPELRATWQLAYPSPWVEEGHARKLAATQLHARRQTPAATQERQRILAKHGSQRAGLPTTRPRKKVAARPSPTLPLFG
jgi:deoxyribodipyrimidine photo-lyase